MIGKEYLKKFFRMKEVLIVYFGSLNRSIAVRSNISKISPSA
jgi:hypothetical protein